MAREQRGSQRRPKWRALMLVAGVVLSTSHASGQGPTPALSSSSAPLTAPQTQPIRSAKASSALTSAIDCQRRGELEQAQLLFLEARAHINELSPTEQQELNRLFQMNQTALAARLQARDYLNEAEKAFQKGQSAAGHDLLKKVAAMEQSLAGPDRLRYDMLCRGFGGPGGGTAGAGPDSLARTKLQQARALLSQGNFDGAEQLAHEAESLGAAFGPRDDKPAKVIEDIRQARSDPKNLLAASRAALAHGDLDRAQSLAEAAEKASNPFTFPLWGDTPTKVRKDIQAARKLAQPTPTATPTPPAQAESKPPSGGMMNSIKTFFGGKQEAVASTPPASPSTNTTHTAAKPVDPRPSASPTSPAPSSSADSGRQVIAKARQALNAGKLDEAQKYITQARGLRLELNWWEDNPEKLQKDLDRARATPAPVAANTAQPKSPKTETAEKPATPAEVPGLLKQGRQLLSLGKLEEAEQVCTRARTVANVRYGLFDDTPEKLQNDLNKARHKRDQAESEQLLVEARKLYEHGQLEEARKLAFRVQTLHGPYDLWHLGDRPDKLLDDIRTAEAKLRKTPQTPPKPGTPEVETAVASTGKTAPANPAKQQAVALMAEAKKLQTQGQLVAARQKALEAYRLKAPFTVAEETPENLLLQLAAQAQQQSGQLVHKASVVLLPGATAAALAGAETELRQARELVVAFGQDPTPIDTKMQQLVLLKGQGGATSVAAHPSVPSTVQQVGGQQMPGHPVQTAGLKETQVPPPAQATDPATKQGLELLQQSLMELRRGDTAAARRRAEEAYQGPYHVKALAQARLREIDIEEFNQRRLAARRSFDAGLAAYHRRDYPTARAILVNLDPNHLQDRRLAQYRELMASPELGLAKDGSGTAVASTPKAGTGPVVQTSARGGTGQSVPSITSPDAGHASISDGPGADELLASTKAMQNVLFQKLRSDSLQVQQEANDRFRAGETQAAIEMLQDYLLRLDKEAQLDADRVALLRRPVENRISRFRLLKTQDEFYKQDVDGHAVAMNNIKKKELAETNKQKNVASLMKQYNTYFKEGKYKEAEMYAMLALDVDPDNQVAAAAANMARMQYRVKDAKAAKASREKFFLEGLNEAEVEGPLVTPGQPLHIDKTRAELSRKRGEIRGLEIGGRKTDAARRIEAQLEKPVNLNFNNTPLRQVVDDLRAMYGLNIMPELSALERENISLERPITIQVEQISLKSALNILLRQVNLTWVIRDDVLTITTEGEARGKLVQKTYQVTDLVIPVENFTQPGTLFDGKVQPTWQSGASPLVGAASLTQGQAIGNASPSASSSQPQTGSFASAANPNSPTVTMKGASPTMQEQLIKLITSSIAPKSWSDMGGPGTIDYFPLTMSLVINQTQDIQEQVADLLAALRRLQDQEVAIEVRFISIAEGFYERMGVDFNMNIKTDSLTSSYEPQLTGAAPLKPAGFVQDFSPSRLIAGLTPAGTFTNDLDIPIRPGTFNRAIPPFGGFPNQPGNNGGLSLGLAFLSDIQVFLFMEMAQGDQRTNVMQAPKLTMYNGQTATLSVTTQQFFVTNVQVLQAGGQLAFIPQSVPFPIGVNLTLQPVISADRRFVRLTLAPSLTNLASAVVPLFPIVTPITPTFDLNLQGQLPPTLFTQYIQQPTFNSITAQTTVLVPDGGTVLLGGLKRLSEGRNEYGPPIIGKVPYLNRLFKNVGYGRETESLLMMVTPRIIINEEEEIIQTGVYSRPQLAQ